MRRPTVLHRAAPGIALALLLVACGSGSDAPVTVADVLDEVAGLDLPYEDLLDHLHAAALANGESGLAHYGQTSSPTPEAWTDAFTARFPGLSHDHARLRSTEIAERVLAETEAGRVQVDVIDTTAPGFALLLDAGVPAPGLDVLAHEGIPASARLGSGVELWSYPYVLGWNTEAASYPSGPFTWDGILDLPLDGCIITDGMLSWYSGLIDMMGADGARAWVDRFIAAGGRYLIGVSGSARNAGIASGEYPCTLGGSPHELERLRVEEGAPVDWAVVEPAPLTVFTLAIHREAPNPYAAALFVLWATGPEGSRALSDNGRPATNRTASMAFPRVADWIGRAGDDATVALRIDVERVLDLEVQASRMVADLDAAYPAG